MAPIGQDPGLETLLDLNGEVIVLETGHWVKFVVHRVAVDERRAQGISYSLSLHDPSGGRIFGIDNAHPVRISRGPAGRQNAVSDHMHRGSSVSPYMYRDASTLLADFWTGVASIVSSGGIDE